MKNSLWSKNFTIITWGTVISAVGGVGLNFALSVLIYNKTSSTLLTAIFAAVSMIPNFVLPLFIGPLIDRFPRRKIIYLSDFLMSIMFIIIAYITRDGFFDYTFYLIVALLVSVNGVIYSITYESFFPELIPEGQIQKGYAISSLIYPTVNTIMFPVAALIFEKYGVSTIFLIEAVLLFIAACFETQIKIDEKSVHHHQSQSLNFKGMVKEGIDYLKGEQGILSVFIFFFFLQMAGQAIDVLLYPFFENSPNLDVTQYALLISFATAGRMFGGMLHYVSKIKPEKRFMIAAIVYFSLNFLNGSFLFLNYTTMIIIQFIIGILSINSYNIRMSAVQSYVPTEKRGRVNGMFHIMTTIGMLIGRLLSGYLGELFDYQYIVLGMNIMSLLAFVFIVLKNRVSIALVYNRKI